MHLIAPVAGPAVLVDPAVVEAALAVPPGWLSELLLFS